VPIFEGYLSSDITANDLILPFTSEEDTHNRMNGGIFTADKQGYYYFFTDLSLNHNDTTRTAIRASYQINGVSVKSCIYDTGKSTEKLWCSESKMIKVFMNVGDTFNIISVNCSATHFIKSSMVYDKDSSLNIFFKGNNFTTGS